MKNIKSIYASYSYHFHRCWRCDKVKQTNVKVHWDTSEGMKIICTSCHSNLISLKEMEKMRKENSTNNEFLKNLSNM
ncbi:hypothetical protein PFNF54_02950 [Plasmodium falciparum NF54]|uniref:Uncharacterized protein n=1 Tax=Plasmodium falciparum (isolate NF54) TaxID=5843 RepID=W7JTF8_PLAFO|nr:hypothetical protein PFNF54_02950 [Plasmodium falciparum NF54]